MINIKHNFKQLTKFLALSFMAWSFGFGQKLTIACEGEKCLIKRVQELSTFAIGLVGFFILASFVTGAIMYITAAGDPERIRNAKNRIMRGVAGLFMLAIFGAVSRWVLVGVG